MTWRERLPLLHNKRTTGTVPCQRLNLGRLRKFILNSGEPSFVKRKKCNKIIEWVWIVIWTEKSDNSEFSSIQNSSWFISQKISWSRSPNSKILLELTSFNLVNWNWTNAEIYLENSVKGFAINHQHGKMCRVNRVK